MIPVQPSSNGHDDRGAMPRPSSAGPTTAAAAAGIDLLDVAQNNDGRLEVFARGADAALGNIWQTAPNGTWSGWNSLGGWIDRLDVAQNAL